MITLPLDNEYWQLLLLPMYCPNFKPTTTPTRENSGVDSDPVPSPIIRVHPEAQYEKSLQPEIWAKNLATAQPQI